MNPINSNYSCFEIKKACIESKWLAVAILVSTIVLLGAAVTAGVCVFSTHLPHLTASLSHIDCLGMLVGGTILSSIGGILFTALLVKVHLPRQKFLTEVKRAIANGEDLNLSESPLLHQAATMNFIEAAQLLVAHGANLETQDLVGRTALHLAAHHNNANMVRWLIERGANINSRDDTQGTPLITAAGKNGVEAATLLLDAGAEIEAQNAVQQTPLLLAAYMGAYEMVELLINRRANLLAVDEKGDTALHLAAYCEFRHGDPMRVARLLIDRGADRNALNSENQTPRQIPQTHPQSGMLPLLS